MPVLGWEVAGVWRRVVELLSRPVEGLEEDSQREMLYVRRSALGLILTCLNYKVPSLSPHLSQTVPISSHLISFQAEALVLEPRATLEQLLGLVEGTATRESDPQALRQAFTLTLRLSEAAPPDLRPVRPV